MPACAASLFLVRSRYIPSTMSVLDVKLRAIRRSHWLLTGAQSASVNTSQSCLLALIPSVNASFFRLMYRALSGVKL